MKKNTLEIAKELGITLKKIQTFRGHDGMLGINADICLNGKPFAHAYDDAWGGGMDINALGKMDKVGDSYKVSENLKRNREIIKEVNDKLDEYPKQKVELGNSSYMTRDSLEDIVNALVDEHDIQKKIKASQKKGLVIETKKGFEVIQWKAGTIDGMLKKYKDIQVLPMVQKAYDEHKSKGEKILNIEYLKSIGIKI